MAGGIFGRTGSSFIVSVLLETHVKQDATDSLPWLFFPDIGLSFLFNKLSFKAVLFIASIVFLLGDTSPCAYL